jgi:hypothetical protein
MYCVFHDKLLRQQFSNALFFVGVVEQVSDYAFSAFNLHVKQCACCYFLKHVHDAYCY